jgi:hypothetical protein
VHPLSPFKLYLGASATAIGQRKTERKTLGLYPSVTLARAREIAAGERADVFAGHSPQAKIRDARRLEKKALTFDDVADRYLREGVAHKAASTAAVERAYLVSARAAFKDRKAKDISRQDVIDFLAARAVGTPIPANRTLAVLATLSGWAVERGNRDDADRQNRQTDKARNSQRPRSDRTGDRHPLAGL